MLDALIASLICVVVVLALAVDLTWIFGDPFDWEDDQWPH